MRWDDEAEEALKIRGYEVIDRAGIDEYQGQGVLLGKSGGKYAVLAWSYGSCSGCDGYEDLYYGSRDYKNDPQNKKGFNSVVAAIGENIELAASEEDARALFDKRKGW